MIGATMKLVELKGIPHEPDGGTIVVMVADCKVLSQSYVFDPKGNTYSPYTEIPTLNGCGTNAKVIDTFLFCHWV